MVIHKLNNKIISVYGYTSIVYDINGIVFIQCYSNGNYYFPKIGKAFGNVL